MLVTAGLTHELIVDRSGDGKNFPARSVSGGQGAGAQRRCVDGILDADEKAQLSFTGLAFSPDGSRIYLSNVNGDIKVFGVGKNEESRRCFPYRCRRLKAFDRTNEIPAGIAVSRDGKKIYVAGNLSNRLLELDAANGKVLRTWDVGVAPFDVVLCKNKIYVSNWGGRRPDADSVTGPAGQGTRVRVDERSIASEGSVSVIDLNGTGQEFSRLRNCTGLHACALALSPDEKFLVVRQRGQRHVERD